MSAPVSYTLEHDVATITMDDGKANALNPAMIEAISEAFARAAGEAKAVVLTGREGVLSAGFDLRVMREGPEAALAMVKAGGELLMDLYLFPLPLVIATPGHAIAAGGLLLLTGDLRIGIDHPANIGLNETSIGLALPTFGVELARDRLDPRALTSATLGAALYEPRTAVSVGYLDTVVANKEELEDSARLGAKKMTTLDLRAFAQTKLNLRQATVDRVRPTLEEIAL